MRQLAFRGPKGASAVWGEFCASKASQQCPESEHVPAVVVVEVRVAHRDVGDFLLRR